MKHINKLKFCLYLFRVLAYISAFMTGFSFVWGLLSHDTYFLVMAMIMYWFKKRFCKYAHDYASDILAYTFVLEEDDDKTDNAEEE